MTKFRAHSIMLVDSHSIWRLGVSSVISKEPDLEVCGQISDLHGDLDLVGMLKPDVVIMDVAQEPGYGVALIRNVLGRHPATRILVLSMNNEALYAERVIRAGARGYLMKQEASDVLIGAIRQVLSGGVFLSQRMRDLLLNKALAPAVGNGHADLSSLTDRELQVFTLMGDGHRTRDIAQQMEVSVKTVDAYRAHIKQKLRLRSGMELIRLAVLHAQPYSGAGAMAARNAATHGLENRV